MSVPPIEQTDQEKAKRRARAEARLRAEHEPRIDRLSNVGKRNPERFEARVSRIDEAAITKQVRSAEAEVIDRTRKDVGAELTRIEGEVQAQRMKLRDPRITTTRQAYRDLGQALTLIGKVRKALDPVR
jgi:hypothetical protein